MESTLRIPENTKLIETFGWVPGQGYPLLDLHLQRLERSALELGFSYDQHTVRDALDGYDGDAKMRCRLTLARDGAVTLKRVPMPPTKPRWVVQIAEQRLNSSDPWLRHKTTNRTLYDEARATMPKSVDDLIFLNERDEVCEGTITNVFVKTRAGGMVTPELLCGCLPGIYRQHQLQQGVCRAAVLTLHDLQNAQWIGLGNALRGAICAEFQAQNVVK